MKGKGFSIKNRLKSFVYAWNGLKILVSEEHNSRIHIAAAICALIAGYFLEISLLEWGVVIIVIGFVFAMEIINTVIEHIADFISPDKHDKIKRIKDLAAAGVLISAITALVVGLLVFLPKLLALC